MTRLAAPPGCEEHQFPGAGIALKGWYCSGTVPTRGTVVYLHGVADNRGSAAGMIPRFTSRGFNVIAYDSRAHGESGGTMCTYGFHEKQDLRRVLDTLRPGPVILLGTSLGAAVALQTAAQDARVSGVVAAEVFSNLASVVRERVPSLVPDRVLRAAFRIAEQRARFEVEQVSPIAAAAAIGVPVLLIHGAADVDTAPEHSERVLNALNGPKRLLLVKNARHNESLHDAATWAEIEQWIDTVTASVHLRRDERGDRRVPHVHVEVRAGVAGGL